MTIEIKVPNLPESVSSATVAEWHLKAGDAVSREQNLVDLETDKVMLEVPATVNGVLKEIRIEVGAVVNSGDVIGILVEGEAAVETPDTSESTSDDGDKNSAEASTAAMKRVDDSQQSPAVRKLLAELDLPSSAIKGTGKSGRLTVEDVKAHSEKSKSASVSTAAAKTQTPEPAPRRVTGAREEQRVPMTRIRTRIAERLVEAQQTAAMLTTFNEVDMKAIGDTRSRYKDQFQKAHGVKLGFMSFFVKASIEALKKYPAVNASIDGNDVVYHSYYDIGVAVSTERGLVVPILRDADGMSFADVESNIGKLGIKARDGKLTMDDLTGGTFSITNGGVFGSMMSTPILNPPQAAILGMHGMFDRPVVVDGEIKIRPMMYLALTYDHRLIDGREAVMFLRTIKDSLEDPSRLLLSI